MALGTVLASAMTITHGSSAGHSFSFSPDGNTAANEVLVADGKLTVCLMDYHHDYGGNEPTSSGAKTQVTTYFSEYATAAYRPQLVLVFDQLDGSVLIQTVYAESSGNDDDRSIRNRFVGSSSIPTWATIIGDDTTSGTYTLYENNTLGTGIWTFSGPGRGSDTIKEIRRVYFVFDLSSVTESGEADSFTFNLRARRWSSTGGDADKLILIQSTTMAGDTSDYGNCFVADAVATTTENAVFFGSNF